jgi:hypothetical protein
MSKTVWNRWLLVGVGAASLAAVTSVQAQDPSIPEQGQFVPVNPCRVLDTRQTGDPIVTTTPFPNGAGSWAIRYFRVRNTCNIHQTKSGSLAYNLTAIGTYNNNPFPGHMLVFPSDINLPSPLASSINFPPKLTIANAAITRMSKCPDYDTLTSCQPEAPGDIGIHLVLANAADGTSSLGAAIHIALDVTGYFLK